jgi:O-antigen ligase
VQIPGFGSVGKLAGALAIGSGMVAVFSQMRIRIPAAFHVVLGSFVLWSALTFRWSIQQDFTLERINTYLMLAMLVWLIWELCPGEWQVRALLEAYVLGTLPTSLDTLQRFLLGKQTYYNRYATEGFDPNDLALTLALSLPMAYYLSLTATGIRPWIYRFQMVASAGTIFLTASRGGTMAMVVAFSLMLWTLPALRVRARLTLLVSAMLLLLAAAAIIPATSWNRILTLASEVSEGTLNSRTVLWRAGWDAFQKSPIQGIGAGAYPEASSKVIGRPWNFVPVAHNSFLSVLVETGFAGFGLFALMLAILIVSAWRMPWLPSTFWLTLLAVWALGVFSLTWEYRKPTWLLFGLLPAHAAAITKPRARVRKSWAPVNPQVAAEGL